MPVTAQQATCPATVTHEPTPPETEYAAGHYSRAEDLYGQAIAQHPDDVQLSAALVHTLLHEGDIEQAAAKLDHMLKAQPNSAAVLESTGTSFTF
jgi:predicted Zn-dependent protease